MQEWLKRLFRVGKAEAHCALDSLENPIKMTEQGIDAAMEGSEAEAQVKDDLEALKSQLS